MSVEAEAIGESVFRAAHRPQPTLSNLTWLTGSTESRAEMMSRRCLERDSSPNPGMVSAKCEVMCLMGRGPWTKSRLASFSGVTDAAAARARGELVLSGPNAPLAPAPPAWAPTVGLDVEGLLVPLGPWLVTVFRDEDREPEGFARMDAGDEMADDEENLRGVGLEAGCLCEDGTVGKSCCGVDSDAGWPEEVAAANRDPNESDLVCAPNPGDVDLRFALKLLESCEVLR